MKLILAGRLAWQYEDFIKSLEHYKYREDVKLLHYVSDEGMASLMGSAYALVYPSYFEGFGLPVAEALQCNTPVITSNASALPEVAADAALYANPDDYQALAEQMMLMYKDEDLRMQLIRNGSQRATVFSWDQAARQFWTEIVATANH